MIYLDYAATTPIHKKVLEKMMPYLKDSYGNASSVHRFGQEARQAIDESREKLAKFLNCKLTEVIFTGSATEANNLAIKGLVQGIKKEKSQKIHVITCSIEHKSILESCKNLNVTYLPVGIDGLINLDDLEAEITPDTDLVSIMYANNEIGIIQDIEKIGKLIKKINKNKQHKIYFHTDAVQAANWLICDVEKLGVDLLTLSAHKIYGPKGVGALYVRNGTPIIPLIVGGDHELRLRAGTENVANIVGMGEAISLISPDKSIEKLRDKLIKQVLKIDGAKINPYGIPNIANFSFKGIEGEALVISLDQQGFAVSTGSACTSSELVPSHVLKAIDLSDLDAHSSIRVSLGRNTTDKEINNFLKTLPDVVDRLRQISGR
ncbi:cysteine desulfurase [Patescibacteria group bacterium]|nr:cysteine desulfurase [Patescibacteria group bacterium]